MTLRKNKPLKINGQDVSYVPKGVKIHLGGGTRESRGQIGAGKTTVLNQEEDIAVINIELENIDSNIIFMKTIFANGDANTITYGNESFQNAVMDKLPDDQGTLETSTYKFMADPVATND